MVKCDNCQLIQLNPRPIAPGNILDVGCATGSSLYPCGVSGSLLDLRTRGWNVHGCDINPRAAEVGQGMGMDIRVGGITEQTYPISTFDVVRFNHLLEHSRSPKDNLRDGYTLLASRPI